MAELAAPISPGSRAGVGLDQLQGRCGGLAARYSSEYCGAVPKLNVGRDRRKLPWYDYLSAFAMMLVGLQLLSLLSGLGILIAAVGALAGGFVALYLAYELGKRLSERFPALKSEHVGFFDR
ncbi:MAG: hypothetical protein OXG67_02355 [bacterium]|nr:hypothetical protein [bacterium]